jgi:hypothetical protein
VRYSRVDISSEIQLHNLRAGEGAPCCTTCRRRPLPGEVVHVYEAGETLCALCASASAKAPLRSERIYATRRQLSVVPRAA